MLWVRSRCVAFGYFWLFWSPETWRNTAVWLHVAHKSSCSWQPSSKICAWIPPLPVRKKDGWKMIRARSTTTRDRNLQYRGAVFTGSFECSPLDFFPFLQVLCVRKWPQNVEKIAQFPSGEKSVESCHVSCCHGFFGPEMKTWMANVAFIWVGPNHPLALGMALRIGDSEGFFGETTTTKFNQKETNGWPRQILAQFWLSLS